MNDVGSLIISGFIGQAIISVIAVFVLKNDLKWLKRQMTDHENRLRAFEQRKHRPVELSELSEFGV